MAPVPIHLESAQLARASLESSVLTHEHLSLSLSLSLSVDCRYCQAPFGEYTPWSIISVSACGGGFCTVSVLPVELSPVGRFIRGSLKTSTQSQRRPQSQTQNCPHIRHQNLVHPSCSPWRRRALLSWWPACSQTCRALLARRRACSQTRLNPLYPLTPLPLALWRPL